MKKFLFIFFSMVAGCTTAPISTPTEKPPAVEVPSGFVRIGSMPKEGSSGGDVEVLQERLNANGAKLTVDGGFGPATTKAISEFQKKNGLEGSGVLGPKTLELLKIKVGPPTENGSTGTGGGDFALSWESSAHPERKAWSKALIAEVRANMTRFDKGTENIELFCPKYKSMDARGKEVFWSELIARMTKFESSYNPKSVYHEPPPLSVDSLGLLQMSYEDGYSYCDLNRSTQSLFDPIKNLQCGTRVLARLIEKDGNIADGYKSGAVEGGARYWAVLRSLKLNSKTKKWEPRESYLDIKAHTSALAACAS